MTSPTPNAHPTALIADDEPVNLIVSQFLLEDVGLCVDTVPCAATSPGATPSDTVKFALRGGLADLVGVSCRGLP